MLLIEENKFKKSFLVNMKTLVFIFFLIFTSFLYSQCETGAPDPMPIPINLTNQDTAYFGQEWTASWSHVWTGCGGYEFGYRRAATNDWLTTDVVSGSSVDINIQLPEGNVNNPTSYELRARSFWGTGPDERIYSDYSQSSNIELEIIDENLIAWYPFNGNANDMSLNNHHGNVNGALLTTDRFGEENSAYSFDGNDYINTGYHLSNPKNGYTLTAWFQSSQTNPESQVIFGSNGNIAGKPYFMHSLKFDGKVYHGLKTNGINDQISHFTYNPYNDGSWHFVGYVYDGSLMQIYVDGQLQSTQDGSSLGAMTNSMDYFIGARNDENGSIQSYFNGKIDDIRLYDRVLNGEEVLEIYNSEENLFVYNGPIWHISTHGSDQFGNGSSDYPFYTIQHAMDSSSDGDTILVESGTYFEQIIDFHDYELVVMSVDGPEQTILDCNSVISGPVVLNGHQSEATVLSGFTIQNCFGNEATIRIENGAATLENLIIRNNSALSGGGLFSQNYNGYISNSVFYSNSVENEGGGLLFWNSNPILNHLTIVNNQSTSPFGCGIFLDNNSNLLLTNSIIWNNSNNQIAFSLGDSESNITIENSNIQNGTDGINVFDNGTYIWGEGNIVNNPLFLNEINDFNLSLSSPCIGSGSINNSTNVDIIGNMRPNPSGSYPDMGAYEHELAHHITIAPHIFSIEDVSNDQGGRVILSFTRSIHDTDSLRDSEVYSVELNLGNGWINANTSSAYGENIYSTFVETPIDSSSNSNGLIDFRVIANMEEGNYVSETVQGYSVDNIVPSEPTNLSTAFSDENNIVYLNWDANQDEDLEKYRIYRNGVLLEEEPIISEIFIEELLDPGFPHISYYVTAIDIHGNESVSSNKRHLFLNDLPGGNSLISIPVQLEEFSTQHVLNELLLQTDYVNFIIGQGVGLFHLESEWSGNLIEFSPYSGYWINSSSHSWVHDLVYSVIDTCETYPIAFGNNLLSFKWGKGSVPTLEALGGEEFASNNFNFIIGQGVGLFKTENGWSGNLNNLEEGKGYWVNTINGDINFSWGFENCAEPPGLSEFSNMDPFEQIPVQYRFTQSTEQAFYIIKQISNIEDGDVVLAYNGNVLVGSAIWQGDYTPVPVMGRDFSSQTEGYCESGDIPTLYFYNGNEKKELIGDLQEWNSLGVYTIEFITEQTIEIPTDFAIHPAYPNPFNPLTNVSYSVPVDSELKLVVYNLNGELVAELENGFKNAGYHQIQWNADGLPSGLYFIRMTAGNPSPNSEHGFSSTQKVLLLK